MICIGFQGISWISEVRGQQACGRLFRRVPTRSCSFRNLYSIPAGCYFFDFHDFRPFPENSCISMDFRCRGFAAFCGLCPRDHAPIEDFTRSQLAAISSSFMDLYDFHDFHGFQGSGFRSLWRPVPTRSCPFRNLYSISTGCYFIDFHGFV